MKQKLNGNTLLTKTDMKVALDEMEMRNEERARQLRSDMFTRKDEIVGMPAQMHN